MRDQASQLRTLVLQAAKQVHNPAIAPPRIVCVAGSQPDAGATSVSRSLASALADAGWRVVLTDIDSSPESSESDDSSETHRDAVQGDIRDVISGECDIHEILTPIECGVQYAAGPVSGSFDAGDVSSKAARRIVQQLQSLGRHADFVIVHIGSDSTELSRGIWRAADEVLLVAVPNVNEFMALKSFQAVITRGSLGIVTHQTQTEEEAVAAGERIVRACRRFLKTDARHIADIPLATTTLDLRIQELAEILSSRCAASAAG